MTAKETAAVQVEMRAAALATDRKVSGRASPDEIDGWRRWPYDPVNNPEHQALPIHGWTASRWAGWLAREIVEHRS
jgi:hypothetical protein